MKKLKFSLLIILVVSLLLGTAFTASAAATDKGLTFTYMDVYRSESQTFNLPTTFEATVYFPSGTSSSTRGGNIIGTYTGSTSKTGFNFEIHESGNPRLYLVDSSSTVHDIIFTNVNVYTGSSVHVAITADYATGTYKCYLGGVLKQTITKTAVNSYSISNIICLGGDRRSGNSIYFKGSLQKVAVYSDKRTDAEIASDASAASISSDGLAFGYDLTSYTSGSFPATLSAVKGPTLNYQKAEIWLDSRAPISSTDYSFALVGDIQTLNVSYGSQLPKLFDWILANKDSKKIAHVFHLGDITDKDTSDEWRRAVAQYNRLNGVIPYSFVRGNHDSVAKYNSYMGYDDYCHTIDGAYEQAMLNTYKKITVGGLKYLIINLDLGPSDLVLDWANELVENHPDYNVIVTTHIYLSNAGERTTYIKYTQKNSAEQMWNKFISKHKNIVMVFCGHSPTDQIRVTKSKGENGNEVTQILVDPQTTDKNYKAAGLVALLHFSNGGKHVEVEYYATIKEKYFLESNQFSFDVDVIQPTSTLEEDLADENGSDSKDDKNNNKGNKDDNDDASSDKKSDKKTNKVNNGQRLNVGLIIGIIGAVVAAVGAGVLVFVLVYSKGKKKKSDLQPEEATPQDEETPQTEENNE